MLKAFWKLSTRDKVVLFLTGCVLVTLLMSLIIFLVTGSIFGGIQFPESTLVSELTSFQTKEVKISDELPVAVNIPGTGLGVNLAGEELPPAECGVAFDAGKGLYTFAGRLEKGEDVGTFASLYLPQMFEGDGSPAGEYVNKVSGKGYLNATFAEYYGGTLATGKDTYYCIFYRYMGDKKDIVFGTARNSETASTFKLKFDKGEADNMFFSVIETGEPDTELMPLEEAEAVPAENSTESDSESADKDSAPSEEAAGGDYYLATDNDNEPVSSPSGYDNFEPVLEDEDNSDVTEDTTKSDEILESVKERKEKEFELAYPGQRTFRVSVDVPEDLNGKEVGIELFFTEPLAEIDFSTIRNDKTGRIESADYLNDDIDGRVLFYIKDCESGKWTIELERSQSLGEYSVHAMEADVLREVLTPVIPD